MVRRSVYSWDIVVSKAWHRRYLLAGLPSCGYMPEVANKLIFDKRDGSQIDFLTARCPDLIGCHHFTSYKNDLVYEGGHPKDWKGVSQPSRPFLQSWL